MNTTAIGFGLLFFVFSLIIFSLSASELELKKTKENAFALLSLAGIIGLATTLIMWGVIFN